MQRLSQTLWEEAAPLADACLKHPFVRGLGDGTLSRDTFRTYIAQDAYFLEAFARAYAYALAHAPDRHGIYAFSDLVNGALAELKLHASYAERWDVNLTDVTPSEATLAYTTFLLQTAREGDVGDTCAAMTPCMRLYAYLGQSLKAEQTNGAHDYMEWITTYSDPGFDSLAGELEALLDRYAKDSPEVRRNYHRAMELELAFFEANV